MRILDRWPPTNNCSPTLPRYPKSPVETDARGLLSADPHEAQAALQCSLVQTAYTLPLRVVKPTSAPDDHSPQPPHHNADSPAYRADQPSGSHPRKTANDSQLLPENIGSRSHTAEVHAALFVNRRYRQKWSTCLPRSARISKADAEQPSLCWCLGRADSMRCCGGSTWCNELDPREGQAMASPAASPPARADILRLWVGGWAGGRAGGWMGGRGMGGGWASGMSGLLLDGVDGSLRGVHVQRPPPQIHRWSATRMAHVNAHPRMRTCRRLEPNRTRRVPTRTSNTHRKRPAGMESWSWIRPQHSEAPTTPACVQPTPSPIFPRKQQLARRRNMPGVQRPCALVE